LRRKCGVGVAAATPGARRRRRCRTGRRTPSTRVRGAAARAAAGPRRGLV